MSKSVEFIKVGDTRRGTKVLTPGTYDLCKNGEHVVLRVRCSIETTETFEAGRWVGGGMHYVEPNWIVTSHHVETLKALPTVWQKVKAFVLRREPPIPRAVTIINRSAQ
jgi:hypothetical protein